MNDLLIIYRGLTAALQADPLLCLAQTVAWFDPLWNDSDEDALSDDDPVPAALRIVRRAFPDLYVDALNALRGGSTVAQIDRLICDALHKQGIPLESIEWMPYGVPLPAYGVELSDPDFYEMHPEALPVLACFGITPESDNLPDGVYQTAQHIAEALSQHPDTEWQQVGWLVRWLFSSTNNSCLDWTLDDMSEVQPLSWEADDIAFARAIIEEADEIMADALAGLNFLTRQPDALHTLAQSIRELTHKKGKNHARSVDRSGAAQRTE